MKTEERMNRTTEEKLLRALEDFKKKYPESTSGDLQTFIIGWREAMNEIALSSIDWDKFATALHNEFAESMVDEKGSEDDVYNWWLSDVTITDIVDFVKNYDKFGLHKPMEEMANISIEAGIVPPNDGLIRVWWWKDGSELNQEWFSKKPVWEIFNAHQTFLLCVVGETIQVPEQVMFSNFTQVDY